MIPPRRLKATGAHGEDQPRAGQAENGGSSKADGSTIERAWISDDTNRSMPTCGSAIPKPLGDQQNRSDDHGDELARDARIWPTYMKEAEKWDEDMKSGCDPCIRRAVFGNLDCFCHRKLQKLAPRSCRNYSSGSLPNILDNTLDYAPPFTIICVNTLWFLSLSLSVSVSLVAMLAKQWCYSYMSGRAGQPHVQARLRHRRFDGLQHWKMPEILEILPTLMHFSLGLTIYLWTIHTTVAIPVLATTTLTFLFYAITTVLPVGYTYCPYNTPLSRRIELIVRKTLESFKGTSFSYAFWLRQHHSEVSADLSSPTPDHLTSRMLAWLISSSRDSRSVDLALQAIAGADSRMPMEPLIQSGVVTRLVQRFTGCFRVDIKPGCISLTNAHLLRPASLYGRGLALVLQNAPNPSEVALEVWAASETTQGKKYSPNSLQISISVDLAVFALVADNYPGGIGRPGGETRAHRASELMRLHDLRQIPLEDYEAILVFGLIGLLKDPEFYSFTSADITSIALSLGSAYRIDEGHTHPFFLPDTFDLEQHLLNIFMGYLDLPEKAKDLALDEMAQSTLLNLLNLQSHSWAHNIRVYDIIAETLKQAKSEALKKSCLTAIGSQWVHTPLTYLLETLFSHGMFRVLSSILRDPRASVASLAMHPMWMMVSKTLELLQNEDIPAKNPAFDVRSALQSITDEGLFLLLEQLFSNPSASFASHHVDMWLWVLENLSQMYPEEITQSNVLIVMADFYDARTVGLTFSPVTGDGARVSSADRLRKTHGSCLSTTQ
ncbi:transmembrane protein [Ceratobasidium sp. AG-Ba]|nr:transmembrane protein [Ceratobasidium sp. AG-Ba]QRW04405.1 transmembrane protein [Ceratobasidium sp. AG-Ba]